MDAATRNVDSASPLPLFRPEVLVARQNFHGEILFIRPFSLSFLCLLGISIVAVAAAFLLLAQYTPTAKSQGDLSLNPGTETGSSPFRFAATFYVPSAWTGSIQRGSRLLLHCVRCAYRAPLSGTVLSVSSVERSTSTVSTDLARPGPLHKVTVAVSPVNSPPASAERLQPGAKLEAEFPLPPRSLIRSLIGPAGY
jgi:hypothetical protein